MRVEEAFNSELSSIGEVLPVVDAGKEKDGGVVSLEVGSQQLDDAEAIEVGQFSSEAEEVRFLFQGVLHGLSAVFGEEHTHSLLQQQGAEATAAQGVGVGEKDGFPCLKGDVFEE